MNGNRENTQDFNAEQYNAKTLLDEEIIRLAKQNSPRLLSKFKSAYPEFLKTWLPLILICKTLKLFFVFISS
ncbi:hypothetical protein [Chryseobacterium indoltheticum]|uniref:hypothetical protein n=1 Tax=Chryseobacterium indoltheticum TaxID=254 RepID=UPI003F493C1A